MNTEKPTTVENAEAKPDCAPSGLLGHDIELPKLEWMNTDHFHCKDCGAVLEFWKRFHWRVSVGVTAVGACQNCGLLYLQFERAKSKWVQVA
jgi:hypothetical protein